MLKIVKLFLSLLLEFVLLPLTFLEIRLSIKKDYANGLIPEKEEDRKSYVAEMLKNSKIMRFAFRMFHTNIETDNIIKEAMERRAKRNS